MYIFQLAVEDKQGYSKFEMLCEELQKQELREKAKKEKKKKKKKSKKNDEGKENACVRVSLHMFYHVIFEGIVLTPVISNFYFNECKSKKVKVRSFQIYSHVLVI